MNWKPWALLAALPLATLAAQTLVPVEDTPPGPELASLMGELQRLTHKLALSADAGNAALVELYTHESLVQIEKIQRETPEYEGDPIALLVDRIGRPAYEPMKAAIAAKSADREILVPAVDRIVQSCNACHAATKNESIRITRGTEVNPFNQDFTPVAP